MEGIDAALGGYTGVKGFVPMAELQADGEITGLRSAAFQHRGRPGFVHHRTCSLRSCPLQHSAEDRHQAGARRGGSSLTVDTEGNSALNNVARSAFQVGLNFFPGLPHESD
jgi:hypothetical protein